MQAHISIRVGFAVLTLLLILQAMGSTPALAKTEDQIESDLLVTEPDTDGDGLENAEELWVANTFAPVYEYDEQEHNIITGHSPIAEGTDVAYYYQVTQAFCDVPNNKIDQSSKEHTVLTIVATYPYDYLPYDPVVGGEDDRWAHNGDTEMIRVCFQRLDKQPANWSKFHGAVYQRKNGGKNIWYLPTVVFLKRHTGAPVMHSARDGMQWESISSTHFRLYISEGKHATYRFVDECENNVGGFQWLGWDEDCAGGVVIRPTHLQSAKYNVGEANKPAFTKINVFNSSRAEYAWGPKQRFCGGLNTFSPDRKHDVVAHVYDENNCAAGLGSKWIGQPKTYTIRVKTSDINKAGTNANVYLDVYGDAGDARYITLDNPDKDDFERGTTDEFKVQMPDVGYINSICVHHDNTGDGSGWNLSSIALIDNSVVRGFTFGQAWLALDEKPNRLWACRPKDTWPSGVWLPKN